MRKSDSGTQALSTYGLSTQDSKKPWQNHPINDAREFHFTAQDFERIRKLIYDRAGISLSPAKQDMVYSRLARRLRATRIPSFNEYLARLERGDDAEMEAFTNSLTTNLTSFFREQHHFPLLAEHVKKVGRHHPISLWCSAASTGEEPYSMAMTMVDLFGTFTPPVHILATDLDTTCIAKGPGRRLSAGAAGKDAGGKGETVFSQGHGQA